MKPTPDEVSAALKAFERDFHARWSGYTIDFQKMRDNRKRIREFNRNWDEELRFFVNEVEPWMEKVPAVWVKPLPFPHPIYEHRQDAGYNRFLAEIRRNGGQEAAFLTNDIRGVNKTNREIVVSRMWLLTALTYDGKVGSQDFWEILLDDVVRELPDWIVEQDGDRLPPDVKTLRNMISVRLHKQFLEKIVGVKISRDG